MKLSEKNINAITIFLTGIIILSSGKISIYPGVTGSLGKYKDIFAFLFIFIGFFLFLSKSKEKK